VERVLNDPGRPGRHPFLAAAHGLRAHGGQERAAGLTVRVARQRRLVPPLGLVKQAHGFGGPSADSPQDAGQDHGRGERLRVVGAKGPPATAADVLHVADEDLELRGY
jgi:hypothetical protein